MLQLFHQQDWLKLSNQVENHFEDLHLTDRISDCNLQEVRAVESVKGPRTKLKIFF